MEREHKGRAPAKLILLGEHFVVPWTDGQGIEHRGSAALALPLSDLSTNVSLRPAPGSTADVSCQASLHGLDERDIPRALQLMEQSVRALAPRFGWDLRAAPLEARSSSDFPASRGFGSSASFSIALCRAFRALSGRGPGLAETHQAALKIENLFHGKSSGLDTSVILDEHPILFRGGEIHSRFEPRAIDLVIADGGPREACSALLERTLSLRLADPEAWERLTERTHGLVLRCLAALENPRGAPEVAETVSESQEILTSIGLATPETDRVLGLAKRCGALAGKISGAGAGGALLLVAPAGEGTALSRRLRDSGVPALTRIGAAHAP